MPPGLEYRLQDCLPPHLFVIRKVLRRGPQAESDLAFYYILDGSVYQAPSIFAAISAKVVRAEKASNSFFKALYLAFPESHVNASSMHTLADDSHLNL